MSEAMPDIAHDVLEELYLTTHEKLLDLAFDALENCQSLLVIGHNPGIHDLASRLADGNAGSDYESLKVLETKMPTCAVALFEEDGKGAPLGLGLRLVEFLTPKPLRAQ